MPHAAPAFNPPPERLAFGRLEVAKMLDISTRSLDRLVSRGAFPKPNRYVGRKPLWSRRTLELWLDAEPSAKEAKKKVGRFAVARPEEPRPDVSKHETRLH